MSLVLSLLDPLRWFRAWRYARTVRYDKGGEDLELRFYADILEHRMLHYGYFDAPDVPTDTLSVHAVERAQVAYAERVVDRLVASGGPVLDIGCGMGSIAAMAVARGLEVDCVTPNRHQAEHVAKRLPGVRVHHRRFERLDPVGPFRTLLCSESFQYLDLDAAFATATRLTEPGAHWHIVDYFRLDDAGTRRPHGLETFRRRAADAGWRVADEEDITEHVLPTLAFAHFHGTRFVRPSLRFALEKLRFKRPFLWHLTQPAHGWLTEKLDRELTTVDPDQFRRDRRYLQLRLER